MSDKLLLSNCLQGLTLCLHACHLCVILTDFGQDSGREADLCVVEENLHTQSAYNIVWRPPASPCVPC